MKRNVVVGAEGFLCDTKDDGKIITIFCLGRLISENILLSLFVSSQSRNVKLEFFKKEFFSFK